MSAVTETLHLPEEVPFYFGSQLRARTTDRDWIERRYSGRCAIIHQFNDEDGGRGLLAVFPDPDLELDHSMLIEIGNIIGAQISKKLNVMMSPPQEASWTDYVALIRQAHQSENCEYMAKIDRLLVSIPVSLVLFRPKELANA